MTGPPRPYEDPLAVERARARATLAAATPLTDQDLERAETMIAKERYTGFLVPDPWEANDFETGYAYDIDTAVYLATVANTFPALVKEVQDWRARDRAHLRQIVQIDQPAVERTEEAMQQFVQQVAARLDRGEMVCLPGGATIERIDRMDRTLTIGRMIHYVLPDESPNRGKCRPAFVVEVQDAEVGIVNLIVMVDGHNDWPGGIVGMPLWVTSVPSTPRSMEPLAPDALAPPAAWGTWHWPE